MAIKKHILKPQLIIVVFLLLIALSLILSPLHKLTSAQQQGQSLEISPPSQELDANPGETIEVTARIRNNSSSSIPLTVSIEDFTAEGEEGQVALTSDSPYSVASWTTLSNNSFSIAPSQQQEVTATIKIPKDAAGGRYGSFVFSTKTKEEGGTASVSQQIASLFLVRISGPVSENLKLTQFEAPSFSEFGPIPFLMRFENQGNVHVKTYGIINVTNIFGQKVADIVVPGTNVFPHAARVINAQMNKKFLIGPFNATAIMHYGAVENQTITKTASFFVFPTRVAIGLLIVLTVLFVLRKRIIRAIKTLIRG